MSMFHQQWLISVYKEGEILDTPELIVDTQVILRPISRRILPEVMESYLEDPDAAKAALPWLKEGDEARRQIADLMIDLEMHRKGDSIHFWAIHSFKNPR